MLKVEILSFSKEIKTLHCNLNIFVTNLLCTKQLVYYVSILDLCCSLGYFLLDSLQLEFNPYRKCITSVNLLKI
jgi:hypothetical protein